MAYPRTNKDNVLSDKERTLRQGEKKASKLFTQLEKKLVPDIVQEHLACCYGITTYYYITGYKR
jgi:hypothetical protein